MKFIDYFTVKLLLETNVDRLPCLYDKIEISEDITVMIFAISDERQEILVAPYKGGKPPILISFEHNKFVCDKCKMEFPIGITEEKFFERHNKEWSQGLDLTRTMKIIKLVDKEHKKLCDLIQPKGIFYGQSNIKR